MKIAATGLSGLVGSRIRELLSQKHEFIPIGLSAGVDIQERDQVVAAVKDSGADMILNLAAKADVDGSEAEKDLGVESQAWRLNVGGAENIAVAAKESGVRLIHISTDFVFDGEKEGYTEEDEPHAVDWYGETKLQGENAIKKVDPEYIIARIAYPYRAQFEKKDFVRAMMSRLENNQPIRGVVDHIMTPTFIDDIANALDVLFEKGEKGIYHVVGDSPVSPYEAALLICEKFGFDKGLVSKTTREEYFKDKAERPFRLFLKNDKIGSLGVQMKTFSQGLDEIKSQLSG